MTGSSFDRWLDSGSLAYWPIDLLGQDIEDARNSAFRYDADVTKFVGPVGQNNIREHASALMKGVADIRTDDVEVSRRDSLCASIMTDHLMLQEGRKIIIIAHSLGGLVAKKALMVSSEAFKDLLQQLHKHTIGVAFLGTPHQVLHDL